MRLTALIKTMGYDRGGEQEQRYSECAVHVNPDRVCAMWPDTRRAVLQDGTELRLERSSFERLAAYLDGMDAAWERLARGR